MPRLENKIASTIAHLPGALPVLPLPKKLDQAKIADAASSLVAFLKSDTLDDAIFTCDAFWRDQFSLTHTLRTFYSPNAICSAWADVAPAARVRDVKIKPETVSLQPTWATVLFTFDADLSGTPAACQGVLYLVPTEDDSSIGVDMKIWMLLTWLENARQQPGQDLRLSPQKHRHHQPTDARDLDALIIGGGQAGLSTAAWCKSYGLQYVVVEKNECVGDNWTQRYDSAKLHTTHRFNDLPFGPTFTKDDPEWLTTEALALAYRRFVRQFGIDVWTSCRLVEPATFDPTTRVWTAHIVHSGTTYSVSAHHIVLCTGPGGTVPLLPPVPGRGMFKGHALHSARYENCNAFGGKRGIVVGSANTAHDVAADMLEAGLSEVTMLQRSPTYVIPRSQFAELFDMIWNDNLPQELSDRLFWSTPTGVSRLLTNAFFHPKAGEYGELWTALDNVGFNVETRGDFVDHLLVRFGGHYMNCGVSQMIADGKIKIKNISEASITHYTPSGLAFSDGTMIDADIIVWATGFEKEIRHTVATVIGEKLAAQLHDYWGVDQEGEVKGAFVFSGVDNCWMTGGGCAHARYFTRFVALQILFDRLGCPLRPYKRTDTRA